MHSNCWRHCCHKKTHCLACKQALLTNKCGTTLNRVVRAGRGRVGAGRRAVIDHVSRKMKWPSHNSQKIHTIYAP